MHRSPYSSTSCVALVAALLVGSPLPADAQSRSQPAVPSEPEVVLPTSSLLSVGPVLPGPVQLIGAEQAQERRLPVLDDAGEPIPYEEIAALVDASGAKGATWGFILGGLAGLTVGGIISQCGEVRGGYRYYCSPREESLQTVLPAGLAVTFGATLGWVGWREDRTTFDEAVAKIRMQRRSGR